MLKPSRRKIRPRSGVSYTSRSWKGVCRRSTRVPSKYTPLDGVRRSKMRSANCSAVDDALLDGQVAAALDALHQHVGGLQRLQERLVDRFGLAGVVGRVIADVHIERCAVPLRPGMDGQVRFREHDSTGRAPLLGGVDA